MSNATLTVGSQFTTLKSGVVGTIQEVKDNKNGTKRVLLDVNGQPRWTTVKQSNHFLGLGFYKIQNKGIVLEVDETLFT